ncbi:hypothetical protein LTR17_025967 [Elasticomyces elasticus]|nr:hypothetical protein LTR17_025967 [Elasticomyces elasticus]
MSTIQSNSVWTDKEAELRAWSSQPASDVVHIALTSSLTGARPRSSSQAVSPATSSGSTDSARVIRNLCASFEGVQSNACGSCIGYLEDATTKDRVGIYHPREPLFGASALNTARLADVLGQGLGNSSSRKIALMAANAVLQLYETPWLPDGVGRYDIIIFKKDGLLLAEYPFVSAVMGAAPGRVVTNITQNPFIRNAAIHALGVLLVELCLGEAIEDQVPGAANSSIMPLLNFTAAYHLERVREKYGQGYLDAVRRCLYCDFNQPMTTLGNADFRKAVYAGVVVPLEKTIQYFDG